jgi:hypothetical protein
MVSREGIWTYDYKDPLLQTAGLPTIKYDLYLNVFWAVSLHFAS